MIRMIQRRLIIPRGDTGSFSIPYLKTINTGDVAVFTIFDPRTHTKLYQKLIAAEGDILNIAFSHSDTVNLKPGKYLWDIKFYTNPQFVDDELVNGEEIDSYYAGFSLPECEIRQTGDMLLTSDDAPTSTMSPESLDIINAAINEVLKDKGIAESAAETATEKATQAAESAKSASNSASAASQSAAIAEARVNEIENLSVEVSTGAEGTDASVTYTPSTGILSFEIPRGNTGNGIASCVLNADFTLTINYTDGTSMTTVPIRGDTPHLTIGTVTEGPNAIATITGTDANPILNLTLPNANVPTRVSELENDAGYLTEHQDISGKANVADLAAIATSGSYEDLSNKPTIPDVRINGHSVINNGIANIPVASKSVFGTLKLSADSNIKTGTETVRVITPSNQHLATFYGLAKAAGTDEKNSELPVGQYTNSAKTAIQQMLGVPAASEIPIKVSQLQNDSGYLTSFTETDPTVPAWAKASTKPSYTAAEVGAPTVQEMNSAIGNAIGNINSFDMAVVQELPTEDISTHTIYLVPKTGETNDIYDEYIYINNAWEMVGNTQIDLSNYVQKTDYATSSQAGISKINNANGIDIYDNTLIISPASKSMIMVGADRYHPIVPYRLHTATFYGLAKAAGDTTQSQSNNAVGTYTTEAKAAIRSMIGAAASADLTVQDVQVNGVSVVTDGVANVPVATIDNFGAVKISTAVKLDGNNRLSLTAATDAHTKEGNNTSFPIMPNRQHRSAFYGLAKAAGDTTQSVSDNTVGNYTDTAKEKIQSMLGVSQMLAPVNPNMTAAQAYGVGEVFAANGKLYKATAAIAQDATIIPDTNCVETTMVEAGGKIKDVQVGDFSVITDGVAKISIGSGLRLGNNAAHAIMINEGNAGMIRSKSTECVITPAVQHMAVFYGLASLAGDTTQASIAGNIGTYTDEAKTAIKQMLGVEEGLKVVRLI